MDSSYEQNKHKWMHSYIVQFEGVLKTIKHNTDFIATKRHTLAFSREKK